MESVVLCNNNYGNLTMSKLGMADGDFVEIWKTDNNKLCLENENHITNASS
jgi:hypothetical protein